MLHIPKPEVSGFRWLLAPALASACLLLMLVGQPAAWAAMPARAAANSEKLLHYTNAERSARNLDQVSRSAGLDATAQRWAEHLASEARMYHSSDPAKGSGFNWRAENLAYWEGHEPFAAEKIHSWWMNSTVHRNNIVHPGFTHVGFGMACEIHDGVPWVFAVAHFGGPSGPVQASSPGQASGGGSTSGMTCGGGSDPAPPPAPEPTAEHDGPGSDERARLAPEPEDDPEDGPETDPSESPAPATGGEPRQAASPTASRKAGSSTTPAPGGSPSPQPPAAVIERGPPPAAAAQLRSENLGAAERADGPLWIVAGLLACALAISSRRRTRWRPKHTASRRRPLR